MIISFYLIAAIFISGSPVTEAGPLKFPGDINSMINPTAKENNNSCGPNPVEKTTTPIKTEAFSKFATNQMVTVANSFYNRPYEMAPDDYLVEGGIKVYRPNHGISHAVRSAAITTDIIYELLSNAQGGEMKSWLKKKMDSDILFLKKVSLMAMMHRSGREDEADSKGGPPGKRAKEMNASMNNFKMAAAKSGLNFSASELESFGKGITLDGSGSSSEDEDHLSRLLRAAHTVELIRDDMELSAEISGLIPEITGSSVKKIYRNEDTYLKVTGDQRHAGLGYTSAFYKLSSDPAALLHEIETARK